MASHFTQQMYTVHDEFGQKDNQETKLFSCDEITREALEKAFHCLSTYLHEDTHKIALRQLLDGIATNLVKESPEIWKGAFISIDHDAVRIAIQSGPGLTKFCATFDDKGNPVVRRTGEPRNLYCRDDHHTRAEQDDAKPNRFHFQCNEINKRSIGKAIIRFCGNEGTVDCSNKAGMRRLLQAVISHIPEDQPNVWKDAEVKIYDDECDIYTIVSGKGHHKFVATFDGDDTPQVVRPKNGGKCALM